MSFGGPTKGNLVQEHGIHQESYTAFNEIHRDHHRIRLFTNSEILLHNLKLIRKQLLFSWASAVVLLLGFIAFDVMYRQQPLWDSALPYTPSLLCYAIILCSLLLHRARFYVQWVSLICGFLSFYFLLLHWVPESLDRVLYVLSYYLLNLIISSPILPKNTTRAMYLGFVLLIYWHCQRTQVPDADVLAFNLQAIPLIVCALVISHYVRASSCESYNRYMYLREQSVIDSMTQVYNRTHWHQVLQNHFEVFQRKAIPLGLVLIDIQDFKQINLQQGHKSGDIVIQRVAEICQKSTRAYDMVGRIGGTAFGILLPATPMDDAVSITERIVEDAHREIFSGDRGTFPIRISAAVCCAQVSCQTLDQLLSVAHQALDKAAHLEEGIYVICDDSFERKK